jgi:glycerol-3-phosphate dehydrogenase
MRRDLNRLATGSFDLLIIGGGIHGIVAAYDAAQRGLSVALVERGDFAGAASFNHLKTVHGGLRYLQSADLKRMRESIVERRTLARIAPHLLTPLPFLMPTYLKPTRSGLAMRVAFTADALIGHDRNAGVPAHLHIPAGRVMGRDECLRLFPDVRRRGLTGGALWYDYQMRSTERLTLAFAEAADAHGACLANYVEACGAAVEGGRLKSVRVRDRLTGTEYDLRATVTLNAAGAGAGRVMEAFGCGRPYPLIKAMNLVTSRPMSGPALASSTNDGRMLFLVPWQGLLLAGTSHGETTCGPDDSEVTPDELQWFIGQVNEAFSGLRLRPDEVTMVHRGVVPARDGGPGHVDLEGHFRIRDHAAEGIEGALSLLAVKYTTGRGVAAGAVDRVMKKLGRRVACRTGEGPLPGATGDIEETAAGLQRQFPAVAPEALPPLVSTYGTLASRVLELTRQESSLADPVAPSVRVLKAQVAYAVREEMGCTLVDVITRRTLLGVAGFPGQDAVNGCAEVMARECGWTPARMQEEVDAVARFYLPVGPARV